VIESDSHEQYWEISTLCTEQDRCDVHPQQYKVCEAVIKYHGSSAAAFRLYLVKYYNRLVGRNNLHHHYSDDVDIVLVRQHQQIINNNALMG
jgi:hypothetical protein